MYYGTFINKYIYKSLEKGKILSELKKANPVIKKEKKVYRKHRHHQYLTEKIGIPQARIQMGKILGLMEISKNMDSFKKKS